MISKAAIFGQVFYQPVMRIGFQQAVNAVFNNALVVAGAFLPYILFNADGGHIKFIIEPAGGGIAKQGKRGRIRTGFVGGQPGAGMSGRYEGGHCPAFFAKRSTAR